MGTGTKGRLTLIAALTAGIWASSQGSTAPRKEDPVRDPHSSGYVSATELPDGAVLVGARDERAGFLEH